MAQNVVNGNIQLILWNDWGSRGTPRPPCRSGTSQRTRTGSARRCAAAQRVEASAQELGFAGAQDGSSRLNQRKVEPVTGRLRLKRKRGDHSPAIADTHGEGKRFSSERACRKQQFHLERLEIRGERSPRGPGQQAAPTAPYIRGCCCVIAAARTTKSAARKIPPSRVSLYCARPGIHPQSTPRASRGTNRIPTHAASRSETNAR